MAAPIEFFIGSMIETSIGSKEYEVALNDLVGSFRRDRIAVFAGAGVSIPSGLPDSRTMIRCISSALDIALSTLQLGTLEDRDLALELISEFRLERILDSIVQFHGNSSLNSLLNFKSSEPNYNHYATAILAKHGFLSDIVTLNFDVLFEASLRHSGVPFSWHLPLASILEHPKQAQPVVTITKLHGSLPFDEYSYRDYYLAATLQYAGDHPQEENIHAIQSIVQKCPVLFVCGYSNYDWDIFPILTSVPWKKVFWIQHSSNVSKSVLGWLRAYQTRDSCLLHGDVSVLFKDIIHQLDISNDEAVDHAFSIRTPDVSLLLANPAATAFSALSLLNGKKNELYRSLLAALGRTNQLLEDTNLMAKWHRAMAWMHHAHEGKPHKAIRRYRKVIPIFSKLTSSDMSRLDDCRSMYYEHVSTLKRPYLNALILLDIFYFFSWRKELLRRIDSIESSSDANPMIKKEAGHLRALSRYDVVDLFHNWGYHLLPFAGPHTRKPISKVFKRIARLYDQLAEKNPDMDWEYRFIRRTEAHLLALNSIANLTRDKLNMVLEMFEQTDRADHHAYTESVIAITESNFSAFLRAKDHMIDPQGVSTRSGKFRIILIQRYFWPETISVWAALKSLIKKSKTKT